ncbi:hypothetical protein [Photobacterium carnosum]|uniref:Uncharacterized protein n=1 Tax=Photobacterium carnosum TaxID=2023717 RepID=A0A2N4UUY7_9GAMM|nr:hypothetical protein [Photobacterium carnosum]KAE8177527.1 hypothetical protein CIT27_07305 [Photobacterium carnosum]MCD9495027.1 hypothetical protein [Photobacterium carnosum]MCD9498106.1 hypothetical protein [Photobacterium carnosum]MCD9516780.1 hypothetical protein [Photobacterium carnosum]MCD9521953.1 hypothetical protein [Photobacterium carnosum]
MVTITAHNTGYTIAKSAVTKASNQLSAAGYFTDIYCMDHRFRLVIANDKQLPYEYTIHFIPSVDGDGTHIEVFLKNDQKRYFVDDFSEPELIADIINHYQHYNSSEF